MRKGQRRKAVPLQWGPDQQKSFDELINLCTSTPVLGFADYTKPFKLYTDASMEGLSAVLYQEQDGKDRVIAYASRRLKPSEKNYPVHKQEFLALKWAVTEKFSDYLLGSVFTAYTDNNPLTYVLGSAKLDAAGHRWVAELANYHFSICYRSGKLNLDADPLSRIIWPGDVPVNASSDIVDAVLGSIQVDVPFLSGFSGQLLADAHDVAVTLGSSEPELVDWSAVQRQDPVLLCIFKLLEGSILDGEERILAKKLWRHRKRLCLRDNILCRQREIKGSMTYPMVLPADYHGRALKGCHDDVGHLGRDRTLSLLRDRFYWIGMSADTASHVARCGRCIRRKSLPPRASLVNITTTHPLEMVCVDFLSLEPSKGGIENILVVTDHFTRYAQAFPTKNQTAKTTAQVLFDNSVVHYGFAARIHSDQGRNFESRIISHLCKLAQVEKSHSTLYHAMGNGQVERFNRTLLDMLGTLDPDQKANWKKYVPSLVHAYNCTRHESTGYSPFHLMFGRNPRLPVDLVFRRKEENNEESYPDYIKGLKGQLEYAYSLAAANVAKSQEYQQASYNQKVRGTSLQWGDRVLVRNVGLRGKQKLADKWQDDVYVVVDRPNPDMPVYRVEPEDRRRGRKQRVLHRNLLLLLDSIPAPPSEPPVRAKVNPRPAPAIGVVTNIQPAAKSQDNSSDESEDDFHGPVLRPHPARVPQEPRIQRQRSPLRPSPPDDAPVPEPVQVLDPPAAYVDAVEEPQQVAPVSPCRPEAEDLVLRTPPRLDS